MKPKNTRLGFSLLFLPLILGCTEQTTGRICQYDPASGQPNPLGTEAKLTIREDAGNTIFTYQPAPAEPLEENIALATERALIFTNTDIDTARVKLIQNKEYYQKLIGEETDGDFASVNQSLTCR